MFCLRLDIDTMRDCEALPVVLNILRRHDARATFFIAAGYDRAGLNLTSYLRSPVRLVRKRVGERYGFRSLLRSIVKPEKIESLVNFNEILKDGNELGLHGYEHATWIRNFERMSVEDIKERIRIGIKSFIKTAKFKPMGFASPGFKANNNLLLAIEDFGFKYSSDFVGDKPFYPVLHGEELRTLQIPVLIDIEGLVEKLGDDAYLTYFKKINRKGITVAYLHPSYTYLNAEVIERTLELADCFATFMEVADENTAHL